MWVIPSVFLKRVGIMSKNTNTKTNEIVEQNQEVVVDLVDTNSIKTFLRGQLEQQRHTLTTEEVDKVMEAVATEFHVDTVTTHVAEYTARNILAATRRKDWWLDKFAGAAINTAVAGAVVAGGYAVVKLKKHHKLFRGFAVGSNPFSNTAATPASPRSLRGARRDASLQDATSVA
jgi:hypothetical protein